MVGAQVGKGRKVTHTFTTAGELDSDARIDVLGEIEDCLALGLVERWLGPLGPAVVAAASVSTRGGSSLLKAPH